MPKSLTDREKVNKWLDFIGEFDEASRSEVLELCTNDKEARAYYMKKYTEDCECLRI